MQQNKGLLRRQANLITQCYTTYRVRYELVSPAVCMD